MEAEMTGGSFEISSKPGEGTSTSALFRTDSLDSIPLGDIISTVCVLINGAPEINFNFSHIIHDNNGENIIGLDTVQIKEVLGGDISLAEPEVIEWIKDYLKESYGQ
jgi:hypothetical protein